MAVRTGWRCVPGLAVAALCIDALISIVGSAPRRPPAVPVVIAAAAAPSPSGQPTRWVVKVDGWTLGLDEVQRGYLAAFERLLDQYEPETPPPFPFLDLIVRYAASENLDWQLVVAVIAEESGFDPSSESDAGAYGLMQVRPIAAREVGEPQFHTPAANIRTGVRYLRRMVNLLPGPDGRQRLALALAAYNMGPAHLADAQALARRFKMNPVRWDDSLELVLPLLEEPGIYAKLPNGF